MAATHVEVFVEEPSAEAALRQLLPRLLGSTTFEVYVYQGKNDLLRNLPARLRGYASWLPRDWRIVVVVDRDNDDCFELKEKLERFAHAAGLRTRTQVGRDNYQLVNRLAIEELEAWYFGDWGAVRSVYPRVPVTIPEKARFRNPDAIRGGTWEALQQVLQRAGYYRSGLRKIEIARAIAAHWDPAANRSHSFRMLRDVMLEMSAGVIRGQDQ